MDDRLDVLWTARLEQADGRVGACTVHDISLAGILISTDEPVTAGEELLIEIEGIGSFAGRLMWRHDKQGGVALVAGPDLLLKKFAERAGEALSTHPEKPDDGF